MQVGTFELTMFIMFLYKQESDPGVTELRNSPCAQENSTFVAESCERMTLCGHVVLGQKLRWVLLDQIGATTRLAINAPQVTSVQLRMTIDGPSERTEVT